MTSCWELRTYQWSPREPDIQMSQDLGTGFKRTLCPLKPTFKFFHILAALGNDLISLNCCLSSAMADRLLTQPVQWLGSLNEKEAEETPDPGKALSGAFVPFQSKVPALSCSSTLLQDGKGKSPNGQDTTAGVRNEVATSGERATNPQSQMHFMDMAICIFVKCSLTFCKNSPNVKLVSNLYSDAISLSSDWLIAYFGCPRH